MNLPAAFLRDVQQLIPQARRFDDPLSTLAFGTDASFYRLIPKLVSYTHLTLPTTPYV